MWSLRSRWRMSDRNCCFVETGCFIHSISRLHDTQNLGDTNKTCVMFCHFRKLQVFKISDLQSRLHCVDEVSNKHNTAHP